MIGPKCKLCGENHWSPVCPNAKKAKAHQRVAQIASRPVKLGSKGKAKKGKT